MLLSIIIVNYKVRELLKQCLHSIYASTLKEDIEIFVVDNDSNDNCINYLQPIFPKVKYIQSNENIGFARANNLAINQASGKYILLLNPDTIIGEHVLENTVQFMEKNPKTGALGVKMIDNSGHFLPESKRGFPTMWVSFCKLSGLNSLFKNSRLFGKYHLRYLDENQPHEVDILCGAYMLLRHEAIREIGSLDEKFFMYGEDIDLSYRIQKSGWKIQYLPTKILHYKGESAHKNDLHYVKIFFDAMYIFYRKHFPKYNLLYLCLVKLGMIVGQTLLFCKKRIQRIAKRKNKKQKIFVYPSQSFEEIIDEIEQRKSLNEDNKIIIKQ